jgi:hypothetical protein
LPSLEARCKKEWEWASRRSREFSLRAAKLCEHFKTDVKESIFLL